MASQGRGIRRSRRGNAEEDEAAATSATPASSAWASFMAEEGMGAAESSTSTSGQRRGSASADRSAAADESNSRDSDDDASDEGNFEYDLSVLETDASATVSPKGRASKKAKTTVPHGTLIQIGTLDSTEVGRKFKSDIQNPAHLTFPTVLLPKIAITHVFASVSAAHILALDSAQQVYGWGRNELDQLTSSLPKPTVPTPTLLPDVATSVKYAGVGKSHTILLHTDGTLSAVGSNKSGQCGLRESVKQQSTWKTSIVPDTVLMAKVACGEDFSVALDTEGKLYSAGSSEFGQLGNGETGEYFLTASKLAFTNSYGFARRSVFHYEPSKSMSNHSSRTTNVKTAPIPNSSTIRMCDIACGRHHALALEAPRVSINGDDKKPPPPRVFSWGNGNYGSLGHGRQADEYWPRMIQAHGCLPGLPVVKVAAGATCSLLVTDSDSSKSNMAAGHAYYWGKHRQNCEAVMRPTVVHELANNGHVVTHVGCASGMVALTTNLGATVVWGQGIAGEFHAADDDDNTTGKKRGSSAHPMFCMEKRTCLDLNCGQGSLVAVVEDDSNLRVVDAEAVAAKLGV